MENQNQKENKRKAIVLLVVALIAVVAMIAGATYAYFQAQQGTGQSSDVNVTTGTTDNLNFNITDLDVTRTDIVDEDNEEVPINIMANMNNFTDKNTSLGDGVTATATLIANDATNEAHGTYNVYLNITNNELQYSSYKRKEPLESATDNTLVFKTEQEKSTAELGEYSPIPELYLTIKKNGSEITSGVTNSGKELNHVEEVLVDPNNVDDPSSKTLGGFDITETKGLIQVRIDENINVEKTTENHTTTDTWEIIVTFINLETDQNLNTGKKLTGKVIIQQEKYTLATACKDTEFAECMAANYSLDNALIKHDGDNSDSNSDLEAGDDSIRYTGGNARISEEIASKIVNDLYETSDFCPSGDGQDCWKAYWLKNNPQASRIKELVDQINAEDMSGMSELQGLAMSGDFLTFQTESLMSVAQDAAKRGLLSDYEGVETLNNYVCVGADCQNNNLYRIIGSFKNKDGNYELKLIKETAGTEELGTSDAYSSEYNGYLWNSSNGLYDNSSKNINSWKESNLNTKNLNGYYYDTYLAQNEDLKNMITKHTWTVGGGSYDIVDTNAKTAYEAELGSNKVKVGDEACDDKTNGQTIPCTLEDVEYPAYIGLMYVSDYYYAASAKYWNLPGYSSSSSDYRTAAGEDWLLPSYVDWTISRTSVGSHGAFLVYLCGNVGYSNVDDSYSAYAARPVFYLESGVKLLEGKGSKTNPYVLTYAKIPGTE